MLVIAHRGASGEYPENTQIAFEQAIAQQADGIELDIQFHAETGTWWLMHDLYVDKTTNGQGQLQTLPNTQLAKLRTKDNQPILQLAQALKIINGACVVNIEVKIANGNATELAHIAKHLTAELHLVVKQGIYDWPKLLISSFNHSFLAALKQQQQTLAIGALIAHCPYDLAASAQSLNAKSINPSIDCLNKELVDDAHQRGLAVWVYTVDRPQDLAFCAQIGVDAIFTNYPARTQQYLQTLRS
ncbi:glycerophosphodiester phosphodiesterase [Thalassotalea euphylliae]|uniref:Glycerophosphodiester phosphodiesterase n=1 Tax=Thalassotalea euphylliae TaxID=1655234 RepID=A0A3E0UJH0_9GAMM|nr:glycerophosphodiester phosphodiesterase family protein [Thalassotalea euphylliae]REL37040.1 glycerophosphodiester phosphodiesterase [Thalassotalea euphylliae]